MGHLNVSLALGGGGGGGGLKKVKRPGRMLKLQFDLSVNVTSRYFKKC